MPEGKTPAGFNRLEWNSKPCNQGGDLTFIPCAAPLPSLLLQGAGGSAGSRAGRRQSIHTALLTASDKGADTMQIPSDKEREEPLLPEQIKDSTGSLRSRMC